MRSLRTQLLISHLLLVLVMGIVMSISIASLFTLSNAVERMSENNLRSVLAAYNTQHALQEELGSAALLRQGRPGAVEAYRAAHERLMRSLFNGDKAADTQIDAAQMAAMRAAADEVDKRFAYM